MEIEVWCFLTQTTPNKKYKWYQPFVRLERKEYMININELKNFNDCMDCVKENHNLSYEEVVSPILDMLKEKCIENGLNPSENYGYLEMECNLNYYYFIYNFKFCNYYFFWNICNNFY